MDDVRGSTSVGGGDDGGNAVSLRRRCLVPEMMDDPELPATEHLAALRGLARLNRVSGAADILWAPLARYARRGSALSVMDIATGSADVPLALGQRARRAGIRLDLRACDVSGTALAIAAERARGVGVELSLEQRDAVTDGLSQADASVDVVTCSLFLHHLEDEQVVRVLSEMRRVARRCVLVSDLRRCRLGLAAAWVASRALTSSRVVHVDAVRSVRAAYTGAEIGVLVERAGMCGARISRVFPFRMLIEWHKR